MDNRSCIKDYGSRMSGVRGFCWEVKGRKALRKVASLSFVYLFSMTMKGLLKAGLFLVLWFINFWLFH